MTIQRKRLPNRRGAVAITIGLTRHHAAVVAALAGITGGGAS
jgi:hypothetical protein